MALPWPCSPSQHRDGAVALLTPSAASGRLLCQRPSRCQVPALSREASLIQRLFPACPRLLPRRHRKGTFCPLQLPHPLPSLILLRCLLGPIQAPRHGSFPPPPFLNFLSMHLLPKFPIQGVLGDGLGLEFAGINEGDS